MTIQSYWKIDIQSGLEMDIVMMKPTLKTVRLMAVTVVDPTLIQNTVQIASVWAGGSTGSQMINQ